MFMGGRIIKQLIIALIFILILSGFGFLIYWVIQPGPSCYDGIQNQEEEKVDCGGPCPACEMFTIEDIKVVWIKAVSNQENFYDLAAQIQNPNQNYGSGRVPYQFELYDSQGNLITQSKGITFILPNQTKYLLEVRIECLQPISRVKLLFGEIEWQKPEDYQAPQLAIQQKEYRLLPSEETGFSQARGVLINKTNFDFEKIDIDVLLFNPTNKLLALNKTEIRTLLAGQERDFIVSWFNQINGQVASVEMEAETNIFDPDNYLPIIDGEIEKFQEY